MEITHAQYEEAKNVIDRYLNQCLEKNSELLYKNESVCWVSVTDNLGNLIVDRAIIYGQFNPSDYQAVVKYKIYLIKNETKNN